MEDIAKESRKYISNALLLAIALYIICYWVQRLFPVVGDISSPTYVSGCFMLLTSIAIAVIWNKVAVSSPDYLPTFHMAVSGFRMLLGLATLFGCYLAVGRTNMAPYLIIFMVFYFVSLIHHSIFFARINK